MTLESMEHGRVIDSNPFVDIATHLFLEDLASKVGVAGLNNYLISLANNLAASMPEEEYESWDEFLDALKNGHSILSSFEDVHAVTKHCMATRRSPFERGWREYAKRVGAFSKVHREVAFVDVLYKKDWELTWPWAILTMMATVSVSSVVIRGLRRRR